MSTLEAQLAASVELQQASPELRAQFRQLQRENSLLRAEVRGLREGRDEFDLDGDSTHYAYFKPQIGPTS